jgi:diguanylate cyclase (GGDEF)-like protein/PAS domain S-box-containing protein
MVRLFSSLRFRLILLVFLAVLPALGVILYSGLEQRRLAADEARRQVQDLVGHASVYQEQTVMRVRQLLFTLAELPMVRQQDGAACNALFARVMEREKIFTNISAINLQGMAFASVLPQPAKTQLGRSHVDGALQTRDFSVGEFGLGRASGKANIHFGYPVIDGDVVQGVVSASVDLSYLNTLVAKTQMPAGAMLTVIDRHGTILARHPQHEQWVGKRMPEAEIIKIVLAQREGVTQAVGIDGVPCLFAFTSLGEGGYDLFVYAGVPVKTVFAPVHRILTRNLLALGMAAVLALAAAWVLGQWFVINRTRTLVRASKQLAAGDLGARSGVPHEAGEFGQLGAAFDGMAAALEQRDQAIRESEAKYRTLVEQMPAVTYMISVDEPQALLYVSPQIETLLGISPSEFLADPHLWKNQLHPDDRERVLAKLARIYATGETEVDEFRMLAASGITFWFQSEAILVRDQEGRGLFIQGVMLDITDRKRAEAAMRDSETKYRLLVSQVPAVVFKGYVDWSVDFFDDKVEVMTHYRKEDFDSRKLKWRDLILAEDLDKVKRTFLEALKADKFYVKEYRISKKNGEIIFVQERGQIFCDAVGKVDYVSGVFFDVTERQRAMEALEESETRFKDITDNAAEWIWEVDREGKYTYSSPMVENLLGYTPKQLLGKHFYDFFLPEEREELKKAAFVAFGAQQPFRASINRNLHKNGGIVWLSTSGVPLVDEKGNLAGYRGVDIDITEQRKAQEALEQANRKLQVLVAEAEERNHNITLLHEMSDSLQSCQTSEEAFLVIAHFVARFFPHDAGSLYIFRNSKNLLVAVTAWGKSPPQETMFAPEECWAMRSGRVHRVADPGSGLRCPHIQEPWSGVCLCVPLVAQGEGLGILHLRVGPEEPGEGGGSTLSGILESKQHLAVTLAENLSLALANLRLRETLRSQAIRDPLTGLFNRRYLEETLARELHRVKRLGTPLGVIMMDLDHFKQFNDTYGHNAGDALLSAVGLLIQSQCREEDIPCRFGGEEFLLALPGASLEVTVGRAQQLREAVKQLQVYYRGQPLQPTTLSLGVAIFPDHGFNSDVIINAADTALYRAKEEGRDRVVVVQDLREKKEGG